MKDKSPVSFRRPWIFMSVDQPRINYLWLAEYKEQHKLSTEVALEHLAIKMREFIKEAKITLEKIEGSDANMLKEAEAFIEAYTPCKDFYSPIPLVDVFKVVK